MSSHPPLFSSPDRQADVSEVVANESTEREGTGHHRMESWWSHIKASRTLLLALLTPVVCLPLPFLVAGQESRCAYVVLVMAVFWITEIVPISVTALLPVVLMPFLGIMTATTTAKAYMSDTIMMGVGALTVALGVETWNLHRRIALRILLCVGSEPRWLMLGMMVATWFLSMWISNTATTTMMIPIIEAILQQLQSTQLALEKNSSDDDNQEEDKQTSLTVLVEMVNPIKTDRKENQDTDNNTDHMHITTERSRPPHINTTTTATTTTTSRPGVHPASTGHLKRMCTGMSLAVCYAANCGGIATITGTGPNLIMKGFTDELYRSYGEKNPVNFATWTALGLPLSAVMLVTCWVWLQIAFLRCRGACQECRPDDDSDSDVRNRVKTIIRNEYDKLGPVSFAEGSMMFWFALMVVLWISGDLGGVGGWHSIFKDGGQYLSGASVSVTIAFILYFYPSTPPAIFTGRTVAERAAGDKDYVGVRKLSPLLTWKIAQQKLPWGLLLLLGEDLLWLMVVSLQVSGLSQWIGDQLRVFSDLDRWAIAFILGYIAAATTEVTSNSAICTLFVPILSSLALSTGIHPLYYLFTGVIACSFAFMLPVATPPNAVVFSYGRVRIIDMMAAGIVMNAVAVPLLVLALGTWGDVLFDFQNPPDFFFSNTTSGPLFN